MNDAPPGAYHEDAQRFRAALTYTASATGFSERLLEKGYFCSILLKNLAGLFAQGLVFKGGTSLSKVHAEFYRLSEDLDFAVSLKPEASRAERRRAAAPIKKHLASLVARLPLFTEAEELAGHDANRQYNAKLRYRSVATGNDESIQIDVSLREEILLPSEDLHARTMLIDPFRNAAALPPVVVRALSLWEAYAEKARAALTRREPAIRDFFDVDIAFRKGLLRPAAPEFLRLVSQKLACTADPIEPSAERIAALARQIETQLKPVLRPIDYEEFDLDRVVALLRGLAARCAGNRDVTTGTL